jgi:hypothetical protein
MQILKNPVPMWLFLLLCGFVGIELCLTISSLQTNKASSSPKAENQMNMETALAIEWEKQTIAAKNSIPTIQPSSTPLPAASKNEAGNTRENPIPLGTEKAVGDMAFIITGVQRPADQIVAAGNMFNTKPEATQEYLMIEARSTCLLDPSKKCSFNTMELKAVGSDGNVINSQFVVSGVPGQFDSGETFGGSAKAGRLFFMVPKGDPGVVIFYEPMFFGSPTFFSIK